MIRRAPKIDLPGLFRLVAPGAGLPLPGAAKSYAGYARFLLLNLLGLLRLGKGDRILLPAYICDVVLLPLARLGIEPTYYAVTDDFQVDWESVRLLPGTRAFLSVNYFGFAADLAGVAAFTRRHDLIWLNDNAHGFASFLGEKSLEGFGDLSFTSFRKVIPSLNGARVSINNPSYLHLKPELDRLNGSAQAEPAGRYAAAAITRTLGIKLRKIPDFSDPAAFAEDDPKPFRLAGISGTLLALTDETKVRERRRTLYLAIERFLGERGKGLLTPIPGLLREGNSPLAFPVVADAKRWRSLLEKSRAQGFDLHTWPSLPPQVLAENICGAAEIWRKVLLLPLHQDLDAAHYLPVLQKVLDAV